MAKKIRKTKVKAKAPAPVAEAPVAPVPAVPQPVPGVPVQAPAPQAPVRKPSPATTLITLLFISILASLGFWYIIADDNLKANTPWILHYLFFYLPIAILAIWLVSWLLIKLIKLFRKHWILATIISGIVVALGLGIWIFSNVYYGSIAANSLAAFQDEFSDVLTAQYLGDDILAGKSGADFASVKIKLNTDAANMNQIILPTEFNKYYSGVVSWTVNLKTAAENTDTWPSRPAPPTLTGNLTGSFAKAYFGQSLNRIVRTKDFGDWAKATGDKDTMRVIAAQLKAEEIFLGTIALASSWEAGKFASSAPVIGRCRVFDGCVTHTKKTLPVIWRGARNYSVGDPSPEWETGWDSFENDVQIENGLSLGGTGIIVDGKPTTQISPMLQYFSDRCKAMGGTMAVTSIVKTRLPTSESGYDCQYPQNGNTCWYSMTYSGREFMGGPGNCPEENLVPQAPIIPYYSVNDLVNLVPTIGPIDFGPIINPIFNPTPQATWNGNYTLHYSQGHCQTNLSDLPGGYFDYIFASHMDSLTVTNNSVVNMQGGHSAIDSAGNVTVRIGVTSGGVAVSAYQTFHFSRNASGNAIVSGQFSATSSSSGFSFTCTQNFTGARQ